MAVAKALEDIITEQAPIVCEQIERAVDYADSVDFQSELKRGLQELFDVGTDSKFFELGAVLVLVAC